jgi:hypothetical protein
MKASIAQIRKAISEDNEMLKMYPDKNIYYFYSNENRKYRLLKNLACNLFHDFCGSKNAYGCFEIWDLLLKHEIPAELVSDYVQYKHGGGIELDIIHLVYGIGCEYTQATFKNIYNRIISIYPEDKQRTKKMFKAFIEFENLEFNAVKKLKGMKKEIQDLRTELNRYKRALSIIKHKAKNIKIEEIHDIIKTFGL